MAFRSSAGSNTDYEYFGTPDMIAADAQNAMNGLDDFDENEERSFFVRALYDFNSTESSSLSFKKGTLIEVLTQLESGWWDGLLGNDTRGWFPSNYVERITDAEAEAELQAQHDFADLTREDEQSDLMRGRLSHGTIMEDNADIENDLNNYKRQQEEEAAMHEALQRNPAKSVGAQYSGLGLGQDFNALRRLMDGVTSNDEGFDAFEQLAEATMTSNAAAAGRDIRDDRLGVIDARRRSRMSDQSSILGSFLTSNGTSNSNHSQSDISSMITRSNAASLSDADNSRKVALMAAESASRGMQNALMDSLEKERIRAHTVSGPEGQQHDPQLAALLAGRPRAQTAHAGMPSTSSTNSSSGSQTILSRKGSKISGHETDSFWIPKVNEQGEIFYYNTQTGQQARDLPEGAGSQEKEEYLEDKMAITNRYGSRTDSKLSRRAGPSSETSDSRPTSSSSLHTAATRHSRMNTIEKIPDSSQVPYPWIVRTSDDDRTFHFFNRQTNEISHDIDHILPSSSTAANEDNNTVRALNRRETVSRYVRSNSIAQGSSKRTADLLRYRNEDEAETTAFQSDMLMKDSLIELRQMIDETGDAIAVLASMASEEIGEDGLSVQDERALKEEQNSLKDESRLSVAIGNVVQKICDLLRAAGALNISPIDLMNASEVLQMAQDDQNAGEALASFQNSVHLLQGRTLSLNDTYDSDPFVSSAVFAATPAAPPTLLPLGKKINATLSKLVLSARSVVEQSCLNAIERPSFTQSQLEKILSYRHRIKDDSMELARALGIFSNEVMHSKIVSRNGNTLQQKNNAYLKSGKANSGIGLNVFGGGSAAGWRGNGFVLPSATEAAVLRARTQMPEMQLSEMTKEAKEAFSTGSIALRRKPTQDLSRETVEEVIASRFAQYAEILSDLSSSLTTDEEGGDISAQLISVLTLKVLRRFGALISWIEELNLASFLDVDGPNTEDVGLTNEEAEEYTKLVLNARQTLHTYGNVKQAAYDACQLWFLCVQDRTSDSMVLPDHRRIFYVDEEVLELVDLLGSSVVQLQSNLAELLHLSEEQAKYEFNSIGARAKVHGIDDIKMKMVEDKQEQPNRQIGGLPNQHTSSYSSSSTALAIPNGTSSTSSSTIAPGASSTASAVAPISESKTASVPPSSLKAMFQRARSTSVATGNSAASNDSNRVPAHDDAEGTKGVSRLRRDTVDGVSSAGGAPSAPGSSIGDHGTDASSSKQAEEAPWFLQPDSPPEDIMLNPNGQVKGATLAALMERLTMHNAFDSSFNSTFLMTYRSFTTTDILLDLLFARFRIQEPPGLTLDEHEKWIEKKQRPIRFRVFNVLKSWLESHFHEDEDEEHMKRIRAFALDEMAHSPAMNMPANLLLRIIERRSGTGEQMKITMVMPASAPPPILPKNFRKIKFLDIDPLEMARQLTLMDSRLYNRIRPSECLGKAWSRDSGAWKAKGVRDVIGANNRVSGWVSEAILVQEDVKKRAAWVKHFVAIADRCFYLNNFSSMMAIYSGLNNASLNRLRRTWDAVNQRHLQLFENMRGILAPTRNFTRYRETLRKLNPPCVPFLGVYLTDLTFIEDGNTDRLRTDDRLINFSKRQMTAEKIQEIMIYQSTPYNLTPVPGLQKFIEENLIEARSDDELFEQSLRLEPREREDEKIARLLQESGFL